MNILFFIPAFLVFLYCLYKLTKDDYVFIRKNVSAEQMLDMGFITLWSGLFFSRIIAMILNRPNDENLFLAFFSIRVSDFSLLGMVLGSILGLYLIGRYKKLPMEHLFNVFSMSFSVALSVGFLIYMISLREYQLLIYFINALLFGIFSYVLIRYLNLKYIFFMMFFWLVMLADSLVIQFLGHKSFISVENILIAIFFVLSLGLLVKQKLTKAVFVRKYKA